MLSVCLLFAQTEPACGASCVRFVPKADILRCGRNWSYSIAWSARPSSEIGTVMPNALAVLRLMYSSTLVACWTGKSAGF
jgi:hypothetical protein